MIFHRIFLLIVTLTCSVYTYSQIIVPFEGCTEENFDNSNPWTFGIEPGSSAHSWVWDNPNKAEITDDITGGGKCLILGGNGANTHYNDDEDSWAMSPEFDLSAVVNPVLEFNFYFSNENSTNYDEIWIEFSLNNGTTWSVLSPAIGANNCYDQNWYNFTDNWGGASAAAASSSSSGNCAFGGGLGPTDWLLVRKCLQSLANESSVRFRFRIQAGNTCNFWGATIDNFKICDANLDAQADYTCTSNPNEIMFLDLTEGCTDGWAWDFGDGNTSTIQNPTHTYNAPGTYTVTLNASASLATTAGCGGPYADNYSFQIEILEVTTNTSVDPACQGIENGSITVNTNGNTGTVNYVWTPAPPTGQGTQNIQDLGEGTYTVVATPQNEGCPVSHSITLNYNTSLQAAAIVTNESCSGSCDGNINVNTIVGGTQPYDFNWSNGAANNAINSGLCNGNYTVVISDDSGCEITLNNTIASNGSGGTSADFTLIDTLNFYDNSVLPIPNNLGGEWYSSCGPCVNNSTGEFNPSISGIGSFQICYRQGSGTCETTYCEIITVLGCQENITFDTLTINIDEEITIHDTIRTEPGDYIEVYQDINGCDSIINTHLIVYEPFEVIIPNVITPNGDQVNDAFYIKGKGFVSYTGTIYTRWGNKINDFDNLNHWKGDDSINNILPPGVYYATIIFELYDGQQISKDTFIYLNIE